jgi:hypothetical protein
MLLRIHRSADNQTVIGICDRELLGTTLTEGDLSIEINDKFFGTYEATKEEVLAALNECNNINMFGERCTSLAIEHGYLEPGSCRIIDGVPHAIIL